MNYKNNTDSTKKSGHSMFTYKTINKYFLRLLKLSCQKIKKYQNYINILEIW